MRITRTTLISLLVVAVLGALAACGADPSPQPAASPAAASPTTASVEAPAAGVAEAAPLAEAAPSTAPTQGAPQQAPTATPAAAQEAEPRQVGEMTIDLEDVAQNFKARGFSPYAGRNFPVRVFWGDQHLHTNLSLDARALGVILSPEDAYRFARGEEITASKGLQVKLGRPLDWLVVTDHSDAMGTMTEIFKGNPNLMTDPTVKDWHNRLNAGGDSGFQVFGEMLQAVATGDLPQILLAEPFARSVWTIHAGIQRALDRVETVVGRVVAKPAMGKHERAYRIGDQ